MHAIASGRRWLLGHRLQLNTKPKGGVLYWILAICVALAFFYLVGLQDAKKKERAKETRLANLRSSGTMKRESKKAKAARAYLHRVQNADQANYRYRKSETAEALGLDINGYNAHVWTALGHHENLCEFDVYGTPAALLWSDNRKEATVVVITSFSNGKPTTKVFDRYDWAGGWSGNAPRGSASVCKAEIQAVLNQ